MTVADKPNCYPLMPLDCSCKFEAWGFKVLYFWSSYMVIASEEAGKIASHFEDLDELILCPMDPACLVNILPAAWC